MDKPVDKTIEERPTQFVQREIPKLTSGHIGLAHHWRRMALLDNDVRLADDICLILEALHSPVSSHILVKRRQRVHSTEVVCGE